MLIMEKIIRILTFTVLSAIVLGTDVIFTMKVIDTNVNNFYTWTICGVVIIFSLTFLWLFGDITLDR